MYLKSLFVLYMMQFVGIHYVYGGNSPLSGMDCSGFAQVALKAWGIDPPGDQTAHGLYEYFQNKGTAYKKKKPPLGSLVFFERNGRVIHVGISLGRGYMIEAGGGDSGTTTREIAEKKDARVRISPINSRSDYKLSIEPFDLPWSKNKTII